MLEQRYSAHFRLHKRFSSEGDRVAHVEVEVLQPARNGTILQEPSKRESFASEASAYEWMDCKLRLNPINSTPPLARKPASMFGAHSFPQQTSSACAEPSSLWQSCRWVLSVFVLDVLTACKARPLQLTPEDVQHENVHACMHCT